MKEKIIDFKTMGDERGWLVAIEGNKDLPFNVKRVFYIFGTDSTAVRGRHANRKSDFVLICLNGTCKVRVTDGKREKVYELDKNNKGLYIPKMLWKDMYDFSPDAILLSISNEPYDKSEYINDFAEYRRIMGNE